MPSDWMLQVTWKVWTNCCNLSQRKIFTLRLNLFVTLASGATNKSAYSSVPKCLNNVKVNFWNQGKDRLVYKRPWAILLFAYALCKKRWGSKLALRRFPNRSLNFLLSKKQKIGVLCGKKIFKILIIALGKRALWSVWPDWAIFESSWQQIFSQKYPK